MKILSIETSCDDTGISIMEVKGGFKNPSFKILAEKLASQIEIHIPYGGVYPALAKREHIKNLPIAFEKVLEESNLIKKSNTKNKKGESPVDAIVVTSGPGLEIALWTGIVFAKELAKKWKVPLIPANHMEGHIVSVFAKNKGSFKIPKIKMPMLALLVSGGHTQLVLMKKWMQYKIIGETLDDAVGEAFDKVARMLDLPYPGGPQISKLAEEERSSGREKGNEIFWGHNFSAKKFVQSSGRRPVESPKNSCPFSLPRPMIYTKDFNFSFSGLKTAVLYLIRDLKKENPKILENMEIKQAIALEFENAAIECLTHKTIKAIEKYKVKTLSIGGGVAANQHLRRELQRIIKEKFKNQVKFLLPTRELSVDNSIMTGMAGYLQYMKNKKHVPKIDKIKADGNLKLK